MKKTGKESDPYIAGRQREKKSQVMKIRRAFFLWPQPDSSKVQLSTLLKNKKMSSEIYSVVVFVPLEASSAVREALASSGAGAIGNYDSSSFSSQGIGRFRPLKGSKPHIGTLNVVEEVVEERVETEVRGQGLLKIVLSAVKRAHPYEQPAIHVYKLAEDIQEWLGNPEGGGE